ncbi:MAG: MoaD/ThiS family protein [Myxococcota bacterium]|nr:MoaD/ThiS family protein [Myxococcota bacterium]
MFLPRSLAPYTGGALEVEVPGETVRALIAGLEAAYPGLAEQLSGRLAVAIDGDIVADPYLEAIGAQSEVHFLPPVGGG